MSVGKGMTWCLQVNYCIVAVLLKIQLSVQMFTQQLPKDCSNTAALRSMHNLLLNFNFFFFLNNRTTFADIAKSATI